MRAIEQAGVSVKGTVVGVVLAVAMSGAGCEPPSPEGRIVASWSLTLGSVAVTCQEALLDRVRVNAVKVDDGESAASDPHACTDGSAEVAVGGGTYLVGIDTLAADDTVLDHGEKIVVVAAVGETPVTVPVATEFPTGFLHARWSPPCPNGAARVWLTAVEENESVEGAPCGPGALTSGPIRVGAGTARLVWFRNDGVALGSVERPYEITGRGQVVDVQF